MPIFEYSCEKCGVESEILVRDRKIHPLCPSCGSDQLQKLSSMFSSKIKSESASPCQSGGCGMDPAMMGCSGGMCGL
jgi:putative FmdB family regulatory protein